MSNYIFYISDWTSKLNLVWSNGIYIFDLKCVKKGHITADSYQKIQLLFATDHDTNKQVLLSGSSCEGD